MGHALSEGPPCWLFVVYVFTSMLVKSDLVTCLCMYVCLIVSGLVCLCCGVSSKRLLKARLVFAIPLGWPKHHTGNFLIRGNPFIRGIPYKGGIPDTYKIHCKGKSLIEFATAVGRALSKGLLWGSAGSHGAAEGHLVQINITNMLNHVYIYIYIYTHTHTYMCNANSYNNLRVMKISYVN